MSFWFLFILLLVNTSCWDTKCVYTYISQLSLVKTRPSCHFEVPFISTKCVDLQLKHVHFWDVCICLIWVVFWVFAAAFTTSWLDYAFVVVTDINVPCLQCKYLVYLFVLHYYTTTIMLYVANHTVLWKS